MSAFMPEKTEQQKPDSKGPEAYLSGEERKALQRSLSFPEDLPPRFKSWLIDFMAVNIPQIPVSQITGFKQIEQVEVSSATTGTVGTSQTTTSATYVDLATVGPQLTGLRNGQYLIFFGVAVLWNTGGVNAWMSISVNGATAVDADACTVATTVGMSPTRAVVKTLSSGNANTLLAKYRTDGGSTGNYQHRWLIAQRIGPVPA